MKVTDVRMVRTDNETGRMRALASVTFDGAFVVHDVKVIDGDKGLFVAMPSKRAEDGGYRDIAHPLNRETRDMIQDAVLDKYNEMLNN